MAKQAKMAMYSQPRRMWRASVEVSSDESGSDDSEAAARDNTDPSAGERVQQAIGRMQDRGVRRREGIARLRQARALTGDRRDERTRSSGKRRLAARCTATASATAEAAGDY